MSGPGANPYLRRPVAPSSSSRGGDGLADVLERVLDKGLVIAGDIQINLLDIELLTIKVRLLLASADTAQQMGIDWWKHDPFLSGRDRELAQENAVLRERVDQLEAAMGAKLAPGEPSPGDLVGEGAVDLGPTRGQPLPTGAAAPTGEESASDDDAEEDEGQAAAAPSTPTGRKPPHPLIAEHLDGGSSGEEPPPEAERSAGAVRADEFVLEPAGEDAVLELDEEEDGSVRVTASPDWSTRTKAELKDELRERDLPVSGTKDELIERLRGDR
jgi:hypothetical protein